MYHTLPKILIVLIAVFTPLFAISLTVGFLIIIDFVTAVYKAFKNNEDITSRKMSNTISKSLLYQLSIICAFLVETFIMPVIPLTKIVAGFIALTELKSISENVFNITGLNFYKKIAEYLKRDDTDITKKKEAE